MVFGSGCLTIMDNNNPNNIYIGYHNSVARDEGVRMLHGNSLVGRYNPNRMMLHPQIQMQRSTSTSSQSQSQSQSSSLCTLNMRMSTNMHDNDYATNQKDIQCTLDDILSKISFQRHSNHNQNNFNPNANIPTIANIYQKSKQEKTNIQVKKEQEQCMKNAIRTYGCNNRLLNNDGVTQTLTPKIYQEKLNSFYKAIDAIHHSFVE